MLDIGAYELIVFVLFYGVALFALYWLIRLAIRHGTLDAYRIDRTDRRIAAMQDDLRSRTPGSGGSAHQ